LVLKIVFKEGTKMSDSEYLEGDIVDNMFGMKGTSAHLEMDFEAATKFVRGLAATAKQEDLLYFYARYKQVSVGKCNTTKPSFYQLAEKSKWNAWTELGEMGRMEAQLQYIQRLTELEPNWLETEAKEPTEGWNVVSSPVREPALPPGEETVWDHFKEGRVEPRVLFLRKGKFEIIRF
jgi:acyl-CoA-binding protein